MQAATSPSALRVQAVLGEGFRVLEFSASTRTAAEAAEAIGCTVAQIAKSILFRAASGRPVLVVACGTNRVDEKKVAALLGEKIGRADAEFVREATGFAIGGVPPVGHATAPAVLPLPARVVPVLTVMAEAARLPFRVSMPPLRVVTPV